MRRIPSVLILALLAASAPLAAAPRPQGRVPAATVELPDGVTSLEIPFSVYRRWMVIPLRVESSPPMAFILDTGATITVLSNVAQARRLPLSIVGEAPVAGLGERDSPTVPIAGRVKMSIGQLRISDAFVAIGVGEDAIAGADGVIGRPLFRNFVVEIDWQRRLLRLTDPEVFRYGGAGKAMPLQELDSGHLVTRATIAGPDGATGERTLLVDTGAGHALSLEPAAMQGLGPPPRLLQDVLIGWGSNGPARGDIGRIAGLNLGGYLLHDVIATFPSSSPWTRIGDALGAQIDGNLGSQVLDRFKVTFDVPHERMYLQPNASFSEPFRFDGSGLALAPWAPGTDTVRIVDVVAGSPADEAGIAVGDEITAIGGRRVASMNANDVQGMLEGDPGETLRIALKRGEEEFERDVTLRRLI